MSRTTPDPHTYFFGSLVDSDMELEFLSDFALRLHELLVDAAAKPATALPAMSDALAAVAYDRSYLYTELYSSLVHETFLISGVMLLERHLVTYADGLARALGIELRLRDITGSTLERFRTFCTKLAGVDPAPAHWEDAKGLFEIRNCLIHNGGSLDGFGRSEAVESFARRHGVPGIVESQIRLGPEAPPLILRLLKGFLDAIYSEALQRFPEKGA